MEVGEEGGIGVWRWMHGCVGERDEEGEVRVRRPGGLIGSQCSLGVGWVSAFSVEFVWASILRFLGLW